MSDPEMRTVLVQNQLAAIDDLLPVEAQRIRQALPREALARVDGAGIFDWEPVETHLAIIEATLEILGPDEARRVWRHTTLRLFKGPIVGTFAEGVLSLLSISPLEALRWMDKLDPLINRGMGSVRVEPDVTPNGARILLSDVPRVILESTAWLNSQQTAFVASLEFLRAKDGRAALVELDAPRGRAVWRLGWR
jgi:hypothetical protein